MHYLHMENIFHILGLVFHFYFSFLYTIIGSFCQL